MTLRPPKDAHRDRAPLRVAVAQAHAHPADATANAATAAQLLRFGASAGADIVVMPDLFIGGHDTEGLQRDPAHTEIVPGDSRLNELMGACYSTRTVAVVGACVRRAGGRRTASVVVVGRDGEATVAYDRQNLDPAERGLFVPGERGCTIELAGWRLGVGGRYDLAFPEHVRAAVLDGCDAYVSCGLTLQGDAAHRRDLYLATRALENTCYTLSANHVGRTGGATACGRSAVYGPDGRLVVEADQERVDVVVATLQDFEIDAARECLTMLDDLELSGAAPDGTPRETIKLS